MKKKGKIKKFLLLGTGGVALVALAVVVWVWRTYHYTPVEVVQDVRAAIAVRNEPNSVKRFMEVRYGPMTEPANRQKAFVDFFNVPHIEGLHLLVQRMPASRRASSINGMAQWVANYRSTMTPEEKASLRAYFNTDTGRTTLQQATAKYLSHDAYYRAATAPVITELMITMAEIQKP